jgi:hypothetical protein
MEMGLLKGQSDVLCGMKDSAWIEMILTGRRTVFCLAYDTQYFVCMSWESVSFNLQFNLLNVHQVLPVYFHAYYINLSLYCKFVSIF